MSDQSLTSSKQGWTKARAILAGGLVLGVGAAITLAAWTDQEWATGSFGSGGSFGIVGATDGATFTEHATEGTAANLNFAVDADNLAPGDEVFAGFGVQLIATSSNQATVTVTPDVTGALAGTTASYVYTDTATCDAAAYAAGTNPNGATFNLAAVTTPQFLCFKVTADSSIQPNDTGAIVWSFDAESTDAI